MQKDSCKRDKDIILITEAEDKYSAGVRHIKKPGPPDVRASGNFVLAASSPTLDKSSTSPRCTRLWMNIEEVIWPGT